METAHHVKEVITHLWKGRGRGGHMEAAHHVKEVVVVAAVGAPHHLKNQTRTKFYN